MEGINFVNASLELKSPIVMLENLSGNIYYNNSISKNDLAKLNLELVHRSSNRYKITGDYENNGLSIKMLSPVKNYESLEFLGNVSRSSDELFEFSGDLINNLTTDPCKVSGSVRTDTGEISKIEATIVPGKNSRWKKTVVINYTKETYGFKFQTKNSPSDAVIDFSYVNILNWNAETRIYDATQQLVDYQLTTSVNTQENGNISVYLFGKTPWKSAESFMISGTMLVSDVTGVIQASHNFNQDKSNFEFRWGLLYMENMYTKFLLGYDLGGAEKYIETQLFFINPKQIYRNVNVGFDVNIDRELWKFGGNATIGFFDENNIDAILSLTLPPPDADCHTVLISYHAQKETHDFKYAVGYDTKISRINYASDGSVSDTKYS